MLTLGEFLAVLSLTITAFSLGYRLGRDKSNLVICQELFEKEFPRKG